MSYEEAAGLILRGGSALDSVFQLTDAGWKMVSDLRRARATASSMKSAQSTEA